MSILENNSVISDVMEKFLQDLARGHSPATRKTYRVALNGFERYLELVVKIKPGETPIEKLDPEWPVAYLRYRADGGILAPANGEKVTRATLSTFSAALARFYRWCSTERLLALPAGEYDRMQLRLKELKGREKRSIISKVPPDEVVEALVNEVRKPHQTLARTTVDRVNFELIRLRNIALIEALRCTGARVSELTGLTRGDLDLTNRRARAMGKGDKERWLYFSTSAWEALQDYFAARSRIVNTGEQETTVRKGRNRNHSSAQPVFARHDRASNLENPKPLTPRSVQKLILELVKSAELDSNITPHKFRHWVATRLLAKTGDLAATQDLLGHASPTTTRIYAQVSELTKKELHRKVFE